MGVYVNPQNTEFAGWIQDEFYVDKTGLIRFTNSVLGLPDDKRIAVSCPRQFGKTLAQSMLAAYYSCGCDSRKLFQGLEISSDPFFKEHLNKHNVISLDIRRAYISAKMAGRKEDFSNYVSELVNSELGQLYPDAVRGKEKSLPLSLAAIYAAYDAHFIILFDEWDVIYREEECDDKVKEDYTDFLVCLFKNVNVSPCIDLVYLTGILPIPKMKTQSGLNDFTEYTMNSPRRLAQYIGFTESDVSSLCRRAQMPLQDIKECCEGYPFSTAGAVYCPATVVKALKKGKL